MDDKDFSNVSLDISLSFEWLIASFIILSIASTDVVLSPSINLCPNNVPAPNVPIIKAPIALYLIFLALIEAPSV